MVTTMTTVGYGDMAVRTAGEQFFVVVLMLFGVFFFSMISGSLASILAAVDHTNAELQEKVMFLNRLKQQYNLPSNIVEEIQKTLSYDSRMATTGLVDFIETLSP